MDGPKMVNVVAQRWAGMSERLDQESSLPLGWLAPLVKSLGQHPRIGQMFPFTSHATLYLSRTTRYPFSNDCPHVDAIGSGSFRVSGPKYVMGIGTYGDHRWREAKYNVLGEGGLSEAVAWIEAALPSGCGPAIDGDLDDLRRFEGKSVTAPITRALHMATVKGDEDEVLRLLQNDADVNATDYDGFSALMMAVLLGRVAMVHLLLEQGADVYSRTADDETALSLALFNDKHSEIVQLLRSAGAVE